MKVILSFLFIVLIHNAFAYSDEWADFKERFRRNYPTAIEEQMRYSIFQENVKKIEAHNREYLEGQHSYYMGINQFTDKFPEELTRLSFVSYHNESESIEMIDINQGTDIPESLDWRDKGAVTSVKNQGDCGSCWIIGTIGSIESQYFLQSGKLISLSAQQVLDCHSYNGCRGGFPEWVYLGITEDGILPEDEYPSYEAQKGQCRATGTLFKKIGFRTFAKNEDVIKNALATYGPLTAKLDASDLYTYSGGVFYDSYCVSSRTNHVVLIVGYGTENGQDYWLVKNSWGSNWGDAGYFKMVRNRNNHCGIANAVSVAYLYPESG